MSAEGNPTPKPAHRPVSGADLAALKRLYTTPRRRGCFFWLFAGLLVVALLLLSVFGLASVGLGSAGQACRDIPAGTPRADVEARLSHDEGARVLGSGGPSGEPPTSLELGVRGELTSWSCEVTLDREGNATRTQFHRWVVPNLHGGFDDPIRMWIERHLPD